VLEAMHEVHCERDAFLITSTYIYSLVGPLYTQELPGSGVMMSNER